MHASPPRRPIRLVAAVVTATLAAAGLGACAMPSDAERAEAAALAALQPLVDGDAAALSANLDLGLSDETVQAFAGADEWPSDLRVGADAGGATEETFRRVHVPVAWTVDGQEQRFEVEVEVVDGAPVVRAALGEDVLGDVQSIDVAIEVGGVRVDGALDLLPGVYELERLGPLLQLDGADGGRIVVEPDARTWLRVTVDLDAAQSAVDEQTAAADAMAVAALETCIAGDRSGCDVLSGVEVPTTGVVLDADAPDVAEALSLEVQEVRGIVATGPVAVACRLLSTSATATDQTGATTDLQLSAWVTLRVDAHGDVTLESGPDCQR